jgi:FtsP/CotA-like multicopper oxidase with cupredoxin domain
MAAKEGDTSMKRTRRRTIVLAATLAVLVGLPAVSGAVAFIQCPDDYNGNGIPPRHLNGTILDPADVAVGDLPTVKCMHLTAGDGWVTMGDGREMYIFGFSDVSDMDQTQVLARGVFRANSPAPTIRVREGDELYLTLTNVGTHQRPDLFDPHSVHYHGFPNASAIFDGLPESAVAINQQASITYYYNNVEPGTYMWHCHVEATEHMQMGMLGNLYVEPKQNQTGCPGGACQIARLEGGPESAPLGYVYNDGDGSTAYDVEYVLQLQAFDHNFHDASRDVQPLPFADMRDTYATLNGRGYPDTTLPAGTYPAAAADSACPNTDPSCPSAQPVSARITAAPGQRVLVRLSNLAVVRHYTVTVLGVPMKVVGHGARLLRGAGQPVGQNVFYETNVVTLGGGESADVILTVPASATSGTKYFLYSTNLNYLSNNAQDFGGLMTEIVVN